MNRAAAKLREILESNARGAYKDLSIELGVGQEVVSKWVAAKHRPSLAYRAKIHELYGIGIFEWDEELQGAEGAA